jgi:hypothetical protein
MEKIFSQVLYEPLQVFLKNIVKFIPNLLAAIFVLLVGILVFWVARFLISRVLKLFRVDHFAERMGVHRVMVRGGIRESLSGIIGRFFAWIILLLFIVMALGTLNVPAIEHLIEKLLLYIPNILVALVILLAGIMLANFVGRAALIASVNAGFRLSGMIGKSAKLIILLISISIAMEHLGIGKETVHISFAIIFGAIALAFAIALGFGGRDLAKEYLERMLRRDDKKDDITHL